MPESQGSGSFIQRKGARLFDTKSRPVKTCWAIASRASISTRAAWRIVSAAPESTMREEQFGQHEGQAAGDHLMGDLDARREIGGAGDPSARTPAETVLERPPMWKGALRQEGGDWRRRLIEQRAVDRILHQPDIVLAGDLGDLAPAVDGRYGQRRIVRREDEEGELWVLLRAKPVEILRHRAVLVDIHEDAAAADQIGAARDRRIGELFEGDLVARRRRRRQ